MQYGVPQGAVLSPTLYNIYTHDAPQLQHCNLSLFADDTAFYCASRYVKHIEKSLQSAVSKYKAYFTRWKIKMNENKTQAIFFTKRRSKQIPTGPLRIGSSLIEWSNSVKYLGFIFDKRLTIRQHIEYAATKCQKAFQILYSLMNRRSKLNERNKLLLYKVAIRPTM